MLNQQLENLENYESELEKTYTDLQKKEQELVGNLNEKYGVGQLNLESGEFIPVEQEKISNLETIIDIY